METWLSYELQDFILFSPKVYFGLFERLNVAAWPFVVLLPAVALATVAAASHPRLVRIGWIVLAAAWIVVVLAFLLPLYMPINWAAWYAIPFFAAEAGLLILLLIGRQPERRVSGLGFLLSAAGALYPITAPLFGRPWSEAEVFALAPDPTAMFTLGLLLQFRGWRIAAALFLPWLWCIVSALTLYGLGQVSALMPLIAALLAIIGVAGRISGLSRPDHASRQRR